jgi:hypothetical protein
MPRRRRHRRRRADLEKPKPTNPNVWARGASAASRAIRDDVWDFINRAMPLGGEGTLTPTEVYALTAYLLFINGVIPEDQVLDQQNLAKVKMPLGDNYAPLPDWKPRTPRLKGVSVLASQCHSG